MENLGKNFKDVLDENSQEHLFDEHLKSKKFRQDKLYVHIKRFLDGLEKDNYFLSLSGGVDSSVLLYCIQDYCELNSNKNLFNLHIDYGNRPESRKEREFIIEYCKLLNTNLEIMVMDGPKRGEIKRSDYENMTTKQRYDKYLEIEKKLNSDGVILGHHTDDKVENIFTNLLKGRNLDDINVMFSKSNIKGVTVLRPLLGLIKKDVFDFAHKFGIPYFKNTTPSWSIRGQTREVVFPKLESMFGNFQKNLNLLGDNIQDLSDCIIDNVIDPFIENNVKKITEQQTLNMKINNKIIITKPLKEQNKFFWKTVLIKILNKEGIGMISNKSFELYFTTVNRTLEGQKKVNHQFKNKMFSFTKESVIIYL